MSWSIGLGLVAAVLASGQLSGAHPKSHLDDVQFGASHSEVLKALGKPFQRGKWGYNDHTAEVGLPPGTWEDFHETAANDRAYAMILHFGAAADVAAPASRLDSLMIEPIDQLTALDALDDIPALRGICKPGCDVFLSKDRSGRTSILMTPTHADQGTRVIYFETAGAATRRLASVPLESKIEWIYTLPLKDFDSHHQTDSRELIGRWHP